MTAPGLAARQQTPFIQAGPPWKVRLSGALFLLEKERGPLWWQSSFTKGLYTHQTDPIIQSGPSITQQVFLKMFITDTPWRSHNSEIWDVFYEFWVLSKFYPYLFCLSCNIMDQRDAVTMQSSHLYQIFTIGAPMGELWAVFCQLHYDDVIMSAIASQITSLTIVYSTIYPGADQSKHQSSASLAFVWGIHRGLLNSPHKWPVTWKMFLFDDVIMKSLIPIAMITVLYVIS